MFVWGYIIQLWISGSGIRRAQTFQTTGRLLRVQPVLLSNSEKWAVNRRVLRLHEVTESEQEEGQTICCFIPSCLERPPLHPPSGQQTPSFRVTATSAQASYHEISAFQRARIRSACLMMSQSAFSD